ncbi:MAG: hypothetical protein AB1938_32400 [Myxococcota bacterium]
MAGGDDKKHPQLKPRVAPAGRPSRPEPAETRSSAFELTPVRPGQSLPYLPRVVTGAGQLPAQSPKVSASSLPKVSSPNLPKATGASSQSLPQVPAGPSPVLTQGMPKPKRKTNVFQKHIASSGFDKEERTQTDALMGRAQSVELDVDEEEDALSGKFYDGEVAAQEVSTRSTWRALKAPVQSKAKKRSPRVLWTVIDQFAVGTNPRYAAQKPGESRGHVFAWDVSMAMGCEIPHYHLGREMTCSATIDWVRFKSTEHGWRRVDRQNAIACADRGELVLVISKNPKRKALGVVRPGGAGDDGHPRVASGGEPRGNDLSALEAIGADAEFYAHH